MAKPPHAPPAERPWRRLAATVLASLGATFVRAGGDGPVFDFEAFRAIRFAGGVACPRCGSRAVQPWGGFSGRRRWLCRGCLRTFSDFTATPLAYVKQLDRWPAFCLAMAASQSVRRTAGLVGVACSTAFRWRHRLLGALRTADTAPLEGEVVVGETCFPFSEKGRRPQDRPPRRRLDPFWFLGAKAWVVLARDAAHRPLGLLTGPRRPHLAQLLPTLLPRLGPATTGLSDGVGPLGGVAYLARRQGLPYTRLQGRARVAHPAAAYGAELRRWLRDFRGVATRYLPNYLVWHRFLALAQAERLDRPTSAAHLLALAVP